MLSESQPNHTGVENIVRAILRNFSTISIEFGAEGCHVVSPSDTPFRRSLFQAFAGQVFARSLDLTAAQVAIPATIN